MIGTCSSRQIYDCHNKMIREVSDCFQGHNASLEGIINATQSFEELHSEVKLAKSAPEAVRIIGNRLSLLNLSYLEKMTNSFKLENAHSLIESYQLDLKCVEKTTIQDAANDELVLMPNYNQGLLISEEILIKMEWSSENNKTCFDFKIIIADLFSQMSCHVMPYSVTASPFVSVRCYAPPYMHGVFSRLAIDNKDACTDVLSVSIGGTIIWERKLEVSFQYYHLILTQ